MVRLEMECVLAAMKQIGSILLLATLLIGTFQDAVVYGLFYLNQPYIAAELCVRPLDPIAMCGGSCLLENTLADTHEDEAARVLPDAQGAPLFLRSATKLLSNPILQGERIVGWMFDEEGRADPYYTKVFRPPPAEYFTC